MATATTPTLGGTTLPMPSVHRTRRIYRGGQQTMADGSIVIDLVDTTARHRFELEWTQITAAQLTTIKNAWAAIKNTTATYVSTANTSHTVTQPQGVELSWDDVVVAAAEIKYNARFELIEDS